MPEANRSDPTEAKFAEVEAAIERHRTALTSISGVLSVRPGYKFVNGWITSEPAIVVTVLEKRPMSIQQEIPNTLSGVSVDVRQATPREQKHAQQTAALGGLATPETVAAAASTGAHALEEDLLLAAHPTVQYRPPAGVSLEEVSGPMNVTCHASPDAGWPMLRPFLSGTTRSLTVGMYDFAAKHIFEGLRSALSSGASLSLVLDGNRPALADLSEQEVHDKIASLLGDRLKFAWAAVAGRPQVTAGIFASAYHIKVAVRDGNAFWLSSGNWQSSDQPDIDPAAAPDGATNPLTRYNRDWHVIVEHPGLAQTFEKYLLSDLEQARPLQNGVAKAPEADPNELLADADVESLAVGPPRFFEPRRFEFDAAHPLRIQPLLTPDNYAGKILQLIESAQTSLHIQTQYIHFANNSAPELKAIVDAIRGKIDARIDVRIILRDEPDTAKWLENLKRYKVDTSVIRIQRGCHNKGILVDGRVVAVGSHNWSSDGVARNRDASLILYDAEIAAYYEQLFDYDWQFLARQLVTHEAMQPAAAGSVMGAIAVKQVTAFTFNAEDRQRVSRLMDEVTEVTDGYVAGRAKVTSIAEISRNSASVKTSNISAEAPTDANLLGFGPPVPQEPDYYLLTLRGPLLEGWRKVLAELGVSLVRNDGGDRRDRGEYKTHLTPDQWARVKDFDFVTSVRRQEAEDSLGESTEPPPPQVQEWLSMLTYDVQLHTPDGKQAVIDWLEQNQISIAGSSDKKIRIYLSEGSPLRIQLAGLKPVDAVTPFGEPVLYNDHARRLLGVERPGLDENHPLRLALDGSGQIVAVADTGLDVAHPDFLDDAGSPRFTAVALGRPGDFSDPVGHGTHVAGSILGNGAASNGKLAGIAPRATLYFQSVLDGSGGLKGLGIDLRVLLANAYAQGARIHNNSWGQRAIKVLGERNMSQYTPSAAEVDEFVATHPDMLVVIAAGNEGISSENRNASQGYVDWMSISSPSTAKNALTVGASRSDRTDGAYSKLTWGKGWSASFPFEPIATETISGNPAGLAAFSSRGPCRDRRIKPDVVAPGTDIASTRSAKAPLQEFWGPHENPHYAFDGGTSMATPLVAGCAALVRQYYTQLMPAASPSAALLKATLINSTEWLPGWDADAARVGKPNYHQGFGRIRMDWAVPNSLEPNLKLDFVDTWKNNGKLAQSGDIAQFRYTLAGGETWLRLCLAHTDPPGSGVQNHLNLFVQHLPSGQSWIGNHDLPDSLHGPDPDNNVEIIRIDNPAAGDYQVTVVATNLLQPGQDFALVVTRN